MSAVVKLDEKDRKILWLLSIDARQSFAQIGKKVGLSKEVVNYRVKRLLSEGVVKRFFTLVDPSALGYITARFFVKFQQATKEKKKELTEYYIENKLTGWTVSTSNYDIGAQFWGKNIAELYSVKTQLLRNSTKHIRELNVGVYHKVHFFDKKYLVNEKDRNESLNVSIYNVPKQNLDEADVKILKLLVRDARMPLVEIAGKTGVSASVVDYKIKKMKGNAIKAFLPMIDFDKLGLEWYKVRLYLDDYNSVERILKFGTLHPRVTSAYEMLADGGLELEVEVESHAELEKFVDELTVKFPEAIKYIDYFIFTAEHKTLSIPPV